MIEEMDEYGWAHGLDKDSAGEEVEETYQYFMRYVIPLTRIPMEETMRQKMKMECFRKQHIMLLKEHI